MRFPPFAYESVHSLWMFLNLPNIVLIIFECLQPSMCTQTSQISSLTGILGGSLWLPLSLALSIKLLIVLSFWMFVNSFIELWPSSQLISSKIPIVCSKPHRHGILYVLIQRSQSPQTVLLNPSSLNNAYLPARTSLPLHKNWGQKYLFLYPRATFSALKVGTGQMW